MYVLEPGSKILGLGISKSLNLGILGCGRQRNIVALRFPDWFVGQGVADLRLMTLRSGTQGRGSGIEALALKEFVAVQ